MENEAILQYFERSVYAILQESVQVVSSFYNVMLLIDSIERVFINGRKAKMFSAPNCFELFEGCCLSNDFKGHPNLIQMCKYLKQEPLAITEKSKQFIGYALKNGLLADFVVDLSKNDDAVCELFDKAAFLRTPSLISTFIQTLISLEKLDFSLTISSQGYVIEEDNIDLQSSKQNQLEKDKQSVLSGSQYTESDVTSRIKSPPSIKKKRKVKNRIVELD